MGGVWERQSRTVCSVLFSLLASHGSQLADESLRTLMCEVESIVNSRPLTVNQLADLDLPVPLTPDHPLTMKSKVLLAPPGTFAPADIYARKRWRCVQHLANEFWSRWRKEFLLSLQEHQKWSRPCRNLTINGIVLVKDNNTACSMWQPAHVVAQAEMDKCARCRWLLQTAAWTVKARELVKCATWKDLFRNWCSWHQHASRDQESPSRGAYH